jgi:hypothetical protein
VVDRPPLRDSTPVLLALIAGVGLWGYYLVKALADGVYWLAALDGVLFVAAVWAVTRVLARRRHRSGAHDDSGRQSSR